MFGSRMLVRGDARRRGMPLYTLIGNRMLSWFQNRMLGVSLSEFHAGYRVYSTAALRRVPFALNTNGFHFDMEIIVQLLFAGLRIKELPIPTYYGGALCHVNGIAYAWNMTKSVVRARSQRLRLFYDRRFDCEPRSTHGQYQLKLAYTSPHRLALAEVAPCSRVLDLACAGGYVAALLRRQKNCHVTGGAQRVQAAMLPSLSDVLPLVGDLRTPATQGPTSHSVRAAGRRAGVSKAGPTAGFSPHQTAKAGWIRAPVSYQALPFSSRPSR